MNDCYLSYLANDNDYKGVLLNLYCLRKYGSLRKYVCICCEDVSDYIIDQLNVFGIDIIRFNLKTLLENTNIKPEFREYLVTKFFFGKFLMFLVEGYEKCVYLDADFLIQENIDCLFDKDTNDDTCFMVYDSVFSIHDDSILYINNQFNSGLLVFKPNSNIFQQVIKLCETIQDFDNIFEKVKTDQEFFNYMNKHKTLNVMPLDIKFNCYPYSADIILEKKLCNSIAVIHYIGRPKPWEYIDNKNKFQRGYETDSCRKYYELWIDTYIEFVKQVYTKPLEKYNYFKSPKILLTKRPEDIIDFICKSSDKGLVLVNEFTSQ